MLTAALALLALAAVPGTPEPQPGDTGEDGLFLAWGNDFFGLPPGPDDNRTNQVTAWSRCGGWSAVVDDSMLTHFDDRDHRTGARSDELTVSAGYELVPGLVAGLGYRCRGSIGGAELQSLAHRSTASGAPVDVGYDRRASAPLAFGVYVTGDTPADGAGYQAVTGLLATTDGDVALDQATRAVWRHRWLTLWAGPRYQYRQTPAAAGAARRAVDAFERGSWVDAGVRFGWFTFESRYCLARGSAVGMVTVHIDY